LQSGWDGVPVLVVGDAMLDRYLWGDIERISPEAPVPVVRAGTEEERPGGAANVAMNLAALGARVTVVGFAGCDAEKQALEDLLAEGGVEPRLVSEAGAVTTTKTRILAGRQQVLRLDRDAAPPSSPQTYQILLEHVLAAFPDAAAVVLSDYARGVLTEGVCSTTIAAAQRQGVPLLVDPKARSFERYRGATLVCPNQKELALACGASSSDLDELLPAGRQLLSSLGIQFMAVTLGERGIALLSVDGRKIFPAAAREVFDVSGAGDTVAAVLALAMATGADIESAVQAANLAAGIAVSKIGTAPVCRQDLRAALDRDIGLQAEEKVIDLEALLWRAARWREQSQRVVFTNGCFDLLHAGHISLLEQARRKGDRLVVGLNRDASVRRNKGPMRPVMGEAGRARILSALSAVDAVVLFEEDTPIRLIRALRPEVLVKGGDYTGTEIVGAREVRSWGGLVEILPLLPGISTTSLIARSGAATAPRRAAPAAMTLSTSLPAS
jgi:D-beta-D-heptose 7-phosphate kinase/D-beta-D-heptose 1-phosphate adenosyltransferase